MNIKPMLIRLQSAMGRDNLIEEMILLPAAKRNPAQGDDALQSVNLVVGYNGTPTSQTALDITLWIAHQTRLVTQKEVTVQVVYVLGSNESDHCPDFFSASGACNPSIEKTHLEVSELSTSRTATPVLTQPKRKLTDIYTQFSENTDYLKITSIDPLEKADHILWQARCLAEEWRGSFKAHLRFGCIAEQLKKVVETEAAALLFLGCNSAQHPIVQQLGSRLSCPVLGVPNYMD